MLVSSIVEGSGSESFRWESYDLILINNYEGPTRLLLVTSTEMDENLDEEELGIEEFYGNSATLIEWPKEFPNNLPEG